jgi:type IV secretory pathway TraG/TraD family ATPase VirD4
MSATRILWGQVIAVFAIVLAAIWTATEWTAWRLALAPQWCHGLAVADVAVNLPPGCRPLATAMLSN